MICKKICRKSTSGILSILSFIALVSGQGAFAEETQNRGVIVGRVVDASTSQPVVGATVIVEHTSLGAATNKNGEFMIGKVPFGRYTVAVSMMGYKPEKESVTVGPETGVQMIFRLRPDALEISGVVVTGTATPHLDTDIPVRTEIISRLGIEQKGALNLADALTSQTGIRIETECQNCNFTQVRILGMDGRYSQILIDGDPVVSSLASVYGLEYIPEEMIGQIEIVKGGGSALYGPGAVAGIVNVVTQQLYTNRAKVNYSGSLSQGAPDQQIGFMVERANENATQGAFIFASARSRAPHDMNGDGFSELVQLKNESLGATWYEQPTEKSHMILHVHRIHEDRRGGNNFDAPPHLGGITEWLEHWRWGGSARWAQQLSSSLDYKVHYSFGLTDRKSYFGGLKGHTSGDTLEALQYYGTTGNNIHAAGVQLNWNLGSHELTAGAQYQAETLLDEATANPIYYIDEAYSDRGIFVQDHVRFGKRGDFVLVTGLRVDKHSEIDEWIVSPRISAMARVNSAATIRASLSTGFMPPQIYNEDLHLCGVGGDQRVTRNSPDLKPERDLSVSVSLDLKDEAGPVPLFFSTTLFSSTLVDAFAEEFVNKTGNTELWLRVNSGGAKVKGIELDCRIEPIHGISVKSGLTYQQSLYDQPHPDYNTTHQLRTPNLYGHWELNVEPSAGTNFYIGGIYTGKMYLGHEIVSGQGSVPELRLERVSDFFQVDIALTLHTELFNDVQAKIEIGVKNLLDAVQDDLDWGIERDPGYFYGPTLPRTFFLGTQLAL